MQITCSVECRGGVTRLGRGLQGRRLKCRVSLFILHVITGMVIVTLHCPCLVIGYWHRKPKGNTVVVDVCGERCSGGGHEAGWRVVVQPRPHLLPPLHARPQPYLTNLSVWGLACRLRLLFHISVIVIGGFLVWSDMC